MSSNPITRSNYGMEICFTHFSMLRAFSFLILGVKKEVADYLSGLVVFVPCCSPQVLKFLSKYS